MRVYHSLVFDDFIVGTTAVYTDAKWNTQLALADKIKLVAIVDSVSGTSPTLAVQIWESADGRNWATKSGGAAEIPATAISATATTILSGSDPGTTPLSGFMRLSLTLGGTTPVAHVKIYVTGRGEVPASGLGRKTTQVQAGRLG